MQLKDGQQFALRNVELGGFIALAEPAAPKNSEFKKEDDRSYTVQIVTKDEAVANKWREDFLFNPAFNKEYGTWAIYLNSAEKSQKTGKLLSPPTVMTASKQRITDKSMLEKIGPGTICDVVFSARESKRANDGWVRYLQGIILKKVEARSSSIDQFVEGEGETEGLDALGGEVTEGMEHLQAGPSGNDPMDDAEMY